MSASIAFLSWVGQVFVVGIGWYVVHVLSVSRDLDKSRRDVLAESIDGVVEELGSLLIESRKYHVSERDIDTEIRIKMLLQDLIARTLTWNVLVSEQQGVARCRSALGNLRKEVTGEHFEDEHLGPLSESAPQLQLIAENILRTKGSLLNLKNGLYARP